MLSNPAENRAQCSKVGRNKWPIWHFRPVRNAIINREEHSMDRYQCRPELQRDLGAIGPYEFQGMKYGPIATSPYFQGNSYGPVALKVRLKFALRHSGIRNKYGIAIKICICISVTVIPMGTGMIAQLIPQQLLMCNWCACNWISIPRALLLCNCLSDIS